MSVTTQDMYYMIYIIYIPCVPWYNGTIDVQLLHTLMSKSLSLSEGDAPQALLYHPGASDKSYQLAELAHDLAMSVPAAKCLMDLSGLDMHVPKVVAGMPTKSVLEKGKSSSARAAVRKHGYRLYTYFDLTGSDSQSLSERQQSTGGVLINSPTL